MYCVHLELANIWCKNWQYIEYTISKEITLATDKKYKT